MVKNMLCSGKEIPLACLSVAAVERAPMYPLFPLFVRKALPVLCLGLALFLAGLPPCPATAQTSSGRFLAAGEAGRDLSVPNAGNPEEASSPWEELFAGSYLGALLFGYPAQGPGLPDVLLACALGIFLLRSLQSRRRPPAGDRKKTRVTPEDLRGDYRLHQDSSPEAPPDQEGDKEDRSAGGRGWNKYLEATSAKERQDMQQRARTVWDALRSTPPESPAPAGTREAAGGSQPGPPPGPSSAPGSVAEGVAVPADFDVEDFLDGARLLYSRLQTSWAARDLKDLAPFATPEMMDILRRQAEQDPVPGTVEVLLVTAVLTGVTRRAEEERVDVAFSAMLEEDPAGRGEKISVKEIWHFVRGPATGGGWRLDGIEQAQ
jgi:hypothetical protein